MDLNLDTLKHEILDYLEDSGLAVFHGTPGLSEGVPAIRWDVEHYPDYRMFLETANKAGVRLVAFATAALDASDIDELSEQLDELEVPRDERLDYEARVRKLRTYEGVTCDLEIAFDLDGRLYVYEIQPDWYEDFLSLEEEMAANFSEEDDYDAGDSLGGYFSKN